MNDDEETNAAFANCISIFKYDIVLITVSQKLILLNKIMRHESDVYDQELEAVCLASLPAGLCALYFITKPFI